MVGIGSIIGGALKAGGAIFGGIKASKAMSNAKKNVARQRQKNQDWYEQRYNEDATQRADAQRVLTQVEESTKNRNRQAAGAAAVMGGTDESVAAAKAANNAALADATARIAANAEARKDNIEATYLANDNALTEQLNNLELKKAQAIKEAAMAVGDTASSVASSLDQLKK